MLNNRKKIYMDLEFTGLHQNTYIVSIGLIADTGETFYAECSDHRSFATKDDEKFYEDQVLPNLRFVGKEYEATGEEGAYWSWGKDGSEVKMLASKEDIGRYIVDWLNAINGGPLGFVDYAVDGEIEPELLDENSFVIVGDVCTYDWVVFCDLFGHALNLPRIIYYIPFDIATQFETLNIDSDVDRIEFSEIGISSNHNALSDAIVIKMCHEKMLNMV